MSCRDVQRSVHAFIDAELEAKQILELEAHLTTCAECRRTVEFERWFKGEIKQTLGRISAPPALAQQVRASLDRAERVTRLRAAMPKIGVAAALVAGVAAALVLPEWLMPAMETRAGPAAQHQVVEYVAKQHARGLPLEVSGSDAASVSQWFRGKVDFAVTPPAFHSDQIKLVGGRLSHVGDEQAAYLVYEHRGRPVTVVVFPDHRQIPFGGVERRAGNRDVYLGQSLGYNVAMWQQGGVNYAVSSDIDQRAMIQLVSSAQ